jgi:8-oxo-dGTP pyrophosphatase MutT (NUDIX family)
VKKEQSFGIIPLRYRESDWEVLLIQHSAGHWSFPKGHAEKGELPQETASRELTEETGLCIKKLLSIVPFTEKYSFHSGGVYIEKEVLYFPALVQGTVLIQADEIKSSAWVALPEARKKITFEEGKRLCSLLDQFLKS